MRAKFIFNLSTLPLHWLVQRRDGSATARHAQHTMEATHFVFPVNSTVILCACVPPTTKRIDCVWFRSEQKTALARLARKLCFFSYSFFLPLFIFFNFFWNSINPKKDQSVSSFEDTILFF